ncbi:hexokinase-3 isoform X2 [Andrographis paniculata]|uniref:hexokinase-3 isoform X2 n=1 Tax=Andrographis paniculata TaxID=175694 RepID=UPI0021E77DA6|nr:hexokinase-3 isoform X2 [Andrographis paniculata]
MGKLGLAFAAGIATGTCLAAAVVVGRRVRRRRRWWRALKVLEELEERCATRVERLRQIVDAVAVEMNAGLASEGGSKLKMLLTHVQNLPTGNEQGIYYALDIGGTNFRIVRVELDGQKSDSIKHDVERMPIPPHLMTGTSEELFDFIATSFEKFVRTLEGASNGSRAESMELGFTFSFPVQQISTSSGDLIKWTKGFSIPDMVGEDVSECLLEAMSRKGLNMQVTALINDSVGTLALGHYYDEDTVAAVTFGTGTNACYLERGEAIIKCQGLFSTPGAMIVNIEWGNFWSSHLPRTSYDLDLDADTPNPNEQGFEKMISGMYLGDIVRRVILRMMQESEIFGPISPKLQDPFILSTPMIAAMHEDNTPDLSEVAKVLKDSLEMADIPIFARKVIVRVCDVVTRRAARLAAAGIVGILRKIGRDGYGGFPSRKKKGTVHIKMQRTVVAVEGGLYANYAIFREYLNEAVEQILGEEVASHVVLKLIEDGSSVGAALVAATHRGSSGGGRSVYEHGQPSGGMTR